MENYADNGDVTELRYDWMSPGSSTVDYAWVISRRFAKAALLLSSARAALLRDLFTNPFRPSPPLPPAVLAWNDGTAPRIAQGIYDERRMPEGTLAAGRLAILADALLDAGCDDEDLIQHCRREGPHVRGCWALDAILGKS